MKNLFVVTLMTFSTAIFLGCQPESANEAEENAEPASEDAASHDEDSQDHAAGAEETEHHHAAEGEDHDADAHPADTAVASTAAPVLLAALDNQAVEAGCGNCIYKLDEGGGCYLAVKVGNKAYPVDGTDVDAHKAGLCDGAQSAVITGKMQGDGTILASNFEFAKVE